MNAPGILAHGLAVEVSSLNGSEQRRTAAPISGAPRVIAEMDAEEAVVAAIVPDNRVAGAIPHGSSSASSRC